MPVFLWRHREKSIVGKMSFKQFVAYAAKAVFVIAVGLLAFNWLTTGYVS